MPEFPVGEFKDQQTRKLAERSWVSNAKSNNASMVGHQCARFLVYKRTRGQEATPPSPELIALFEEGNTQEGEAIQIIRSLGYNYERSQEAFSIKDVEIGAKMDGVTYLRSGGKVVGKWASEIKSVNDYTFKALDHVSQLKNGHHWHYRWLVQIQLAIYHVMEREGFDDTGVLWLKDKTRRYLKPINIPLDRAVLDETFAKCHVINRHLKAGTLPERIPYTDGICIHCDFKHICNPEEIFLAGEKLDDPSFIEKLKQREKLAASSKEYTALDKEIKTVLRNKQYAVAGPFVITGKKFGANGWKTEIERTMEDKDSETVDQLQQLSNLSPITENHVKKIRECLTSVELRMIQADIKGLAKDDKFSPDEKEILSECFVRKMRELKAIADLEIIEPINIGAMNGQEESYMTRGGKRIYTKDRINWYTKDESEAAK